MRLIPKIWFFLVIAQNGNTTRRLKSKLPVPIDKKKLRELERLESSRQSIITSAREASTTALKYKRQMKSLQEQIRYVMFLFIYLWIFNPPPHFNSNKLLSMRVLSCLSCETPTIEIFEISSNFYSNLYQSATDRLMSCSLSISN